ncbi:MAG TPA: hypothetical protein PK970_00010 [Hyphomicrobiaceae bacterium]|nr:hypothetical protein [Hyphomicrobiaceae bacterium]
MQQIIESGQIADHILLVMAAEAGGILLYARRRQLPSRRIAETLAGLAAGASLVMALRFALTDSGWIFIAAALVASLVAHLTETMFRLGRTPG